MADATDDRRIGSVIAGYRIDSRIGRGGMGVVYRGRHEKLPRAVAVKSISPKGTHDLRRLRHRFEREAFVQAQLDHPGIVKIYDYIVSEQSYFIVMEYVEGRSLAQLIKENPGGIEQERALDIFEQILSASGTRILKFYLHISEEEQQQRLEERLEDPRKNWKFSANDAKERGFWDDYMKAYEEMIRATATKDSPWYVVPADNKWFTRVIVAAAVIDALDSLNLRYPKVSAAKKKELAEARELLIAAK